MNSNPHDDPKTPASASSPAEETLRLLAGLPAPAGLEERVHSALSAAPGAAPRRGRVLAWSRGRVLAGSSPIRPETRWMRSAAAAAIVFVVAGGGWGVYTHVELNQPARVIVMPARMPVTGGFAGAGAMRPPQTLPGPKAPQRVKSQPTASKKPASRLKAASKASPARP